MISKAELFGEKTVWRGRKAYLLGNGIVQLTTLIGGGHIAELRFSESTGLPALSPLWVPPWDTIEPYTYKPKIHTSRYGTLTEGKLLSGLVGHNICLDYFGSPSPEEAEQGLSQHGEAPSARWQKKDLRVTANEVALTLSVGLPVAGLRFRREMCLRRGESVVYFTETVFNERKADHFFHWTQHVTLGPPFLSHRDSRVLIPATKGITFPHGYDEGKALLASGQEFRWPMAPLRKGRTVDLTRPLLRRGLGFVVSVLLNPSRDVAYVTAINDRERLVIGYCFNRLDFPWVAVWEENHAIANAPWKQETQARGLEFGTTPLPVMRREAYARSQLFGVPTFTCVPARGRKTIRYSAFLAQAPNNFGPLQDVRVSGNEIVIVGRKPRTEIRVPASRLQRPLSVTKYKPQRPGDAEGKS